LQDLERQRIKNAWKRKAGVRRTFVASRRSYGCSPDLSWNIECMGKRRNTDLGNIYRWTSSAKRMV